MRVLIGSIEGDAGALQCQLAHAKVVEECRSCRSLVLAVDEGACPTFGTGIRVLATGDGHDTDGSRVSVLLHLRDGYVELLEVVRADGELASQLPEPDDLVVTPGV